MNKYSRKAFFCYVGAITVAIILFFSDFQKGSFQNNILIFAMCFILVWAFIFTILSFPEDKNNEKI